MKSAILFLFASLTACSVPDLGEPPDDSQTYTPSNKTTDKSQSSNSTSTSADGAETTDPSESTPQGGDTSTAGAQRWHGSLPTATPTAFGGGGFCMYRITMKDIAVDLATDDSGKVILASVTATAVEDVAASDCGIPYPANEHHYGLTMASVMPNGVTHLELAGASTNKPAATLVVEGDLSQPKPMLTLRWHRTDQPPPLDWKVNAQVPATAQ